MTSGDPYREEPPWYLEPGPETCEFCLSAYHYEAGYHCVECDRPVCPLCVLEVHASRAIMCPECRSEAEQ